MVKARKYILAKHFEGLPKAGDLKIVEEELSPLKDGEFLAEAVYLSVDPYQRLLDRELELGALFFGSQVAKLIESKSEKYPVGKYVVGHLGWRSHTIANDKPDNFTQLPPTVLPDFGGLSPSLALSVFGAPGHTSYFGFLDICKPKAGETVVVSGAAGAVGNHVGQIAKIKGCTVIGIAGDNKKGAWLVNELGFDHFINYKEPGLDKKLLQCATKGVDCYFDNVGGELSSTIISQMNPDGRISVCGAISGYNDLSNLPKAASIQSFMVLKRLTMQGFQVQTWADRYQEAIAQNLKWVKEGKLKYRETVTEGFDNTFKAFLDMLQGGNSGKAIVKV